MGTPAAAVPVPWREVTVVRRPEVVVVAVGERALAVAPGRPAREVDELGVLALSGPATGTRVGDLAAELDPAGFEGDAVALVAEVARWLADADLATLFSDADGPAEPHLAGASAAPLVAAREPARPEILRGGWLLWEGDGVRVVAETARARVPGVAEWRAPLWITADGTRLGGAPAEGAGASGTEGDPGAGPSPEDAEGTVRLVGVDVDVDGDDPVQVAAAAIDALVPPTPEELGPAAAFVVALAERGVIRRRAAEPVEEAPIPEAVSGIVAAAVVESRSRSTKVSPGRVDAEREVWMLRVDPGRTTASHVAAELARFALPADVATSVADLEGHDGRLIVGVEPGSTHGRDRHKLYVACNSWQPWDALRRAWPDLDELHRASVLFGDAEPDAPPRFVAWKRSADAPETVAVYRRATARTITIADALERVLPTGSGWVGAVRAVFGHDRDPDELLTGDDLEVIDTDGRRSIDLLVAGPRPRGERIAAVHALLDLAGIDPDLADRTAPAIGRARINRLIAGTDAAGEPFLSIYTD